MCWDISLRTDLRKLKQAFPDLLDQRKRRDGDNYYLENVQAVTFPEYPILYRDYVTGELALTEMEWGVLPLYITDPQEQINRRRNQINIRSERILGDHRSLWYRLRRQRCLIPVSGTYEHRKIQGWSKKVPYYIAEKGRTLFFLPGLYQFQEIIDEDAVVTKLGSFGMLTRSANAVMAQIHNDGPNKGRMPLYLTPGLEQEWISDIQEQAMASIFGYAIPPEAQDYHPVYTLRGYPKRPDGKPRYEAFHWDGLPPLGNDIPGHLHG